MMKILACQRNFSWILIVSTFAFAVKSNAVDNYILTKVDLSQNSILPFEPLVVSPSLVNGGREPQQLEIPAGIWEIQIYTRIGTQEEWKAFNNVGSDIPDRGYSSLQVNLNSQQEIKTVTNLQFDKNFQAVFANPGEHWIKAQYSVYSAIPSRLQVREPIGEDRAAYEFLKVHPLWRYFSTDSARELSFREDPSTKATYLRAQQELDDFSRKFPKSRYALWAKLGQVFAHEIPNLGRFLTGRIDRSSKELRQDAIRLEQLAVTLPVPLNTVALFEAGRANSLLSDATKANTLFEKAIATGTPTIKEEVKKWRAFLVENPNVVDRPALLTPESILDQAIKQLEQERYDLKAFAKEHPESFKIYSKNAASLMQQNNSGQISAKETYSRMAQLLLETIRKYSQPLSSEEWQRRQVQYAAPK